MLTEREIELYGQLDWYIAVVCGLIFTCFLLSYKVMPSVIPGEKKVTPLGFFFGTSCLKYVRRPGDPPWTVDDFPHWKDGTNPEYDIVSFGAEMERMWNPADKRRLLYRLLWHMAPWWSYSMFMSGCERLMSYISMSYTTTVVITLLLSDTVPSWGGTTLKLMLLGFILSVGCAAVNQWAKVIMALRGTDPFYVGLTLLVVQKMQRLSGTGMLQTNSAEAQQVAQECYFLAVNFWATPLQTVVIDVLLGSLSLWKLYCQIGVLGIIVAVILLASLFGVGTLFDIRRRDLDVSNYEATVKRQTTLNVLLDTFRELRLYDWVNRAARPLAGVRATIRSNFWWSTLYSALGGVFTNQIDGVMTVATCFFFVFVQKKRVDFGETQTARAYMGTLLMITMSLSACRMAWFDAVNRAQRIENFLRLPELSPKDKSKGPLQVTDATFAYPVAPKKDEDGKDITPEPTAVLTDINLKPTEGELVLVCGAIGAGKSSLLTALLGELEQLQGERSIPDVPIAYQPQVPLLIDGTIRDNVLFGIEDEDCNEKHLKQALAAAQLAVDISDPGNTLHAKGERTHVGKRGTHLSGGQRARTALARSVYAVLEGAPVALLDDPVASVDNEVLRNAWDAAVLQAMRGVTRIVAVNAQLLRRLAPSADRLVLLENGQIVYDGPPSEGLENLKSLSDSRQPSEMLPTTASQNPEVPASPEESSVMNEESSLPGQLSDWAEKEDTGNLSVEDSALGVADLLRECEPLRKYVQGSTCAGMPPKLTPVQWEALRVHLSRLERGCWRGPSAALGGSSRGFLCTIKMVSSFFYHKSFWWFPLAAVFEVACTLESAFTFTTAERWQNGTLGLSNVNSLLIFTLQIVLFSSCSTYCNHMSVMGITGISADLRSSVHRTLASLGLPYFWHGRHEAEARLRRVLDLKMDELAVLGKLPTGMVQMILFFLVTCSKERLLAPFALLSAILLSMLNGPKAWIAKQVDPQEREISAQVQVRVLEQFNSVVTLRALGCTAELEKRILPKMMAPAYATFWRCSVDMHVALISGIVHVLFTVSGKLSIMHMRAKGADASEAMLFDTLISGISGCLFMLSGVYIPFIMSVEKFKELSEFLQTDFLESDTGKDPPPTWPTQGHISLENVTFRYAPHLPAALHHLSLEVQPQEKLGIVGRTGAGKSTLASLLLRLGPLKGVPPYSAGRVLLDGVDIAGLKLSRLRRAIALVPQEPAIFRMSLKANLGGEEFTDAEVATALVHCGLDARQLTGKDTLGEALASELAPSSISMGQLQMLMTARALVRRPKVLVLDECTASLDCSTADQLLRVIGTHCADATVLSIAHRLRFVLRCDRILVLGNGGKILNLDTPSSLMEDEGGYFATCLKHEELEDQRGK